MGVGGPGERRRVDHDQREVLPRFREELPHPRRSEERGGIAVRISRREQGETLEARGAHHCAERSHRSDAAQRTAPGTGNLLRSEAKYRLPLRVACVLERTLKLLGVLARRPLEPVDQTGGTRGTETKVQDGTTEIGVDEESPEAETGGGAPELLGDETAACTPLGSGQQEDPPALHPGDHLARQGVERFANSSGETARESSSIHRIEMGENCETRHSAASPQRHTVVHPGIEVVDRVGDSDGDHRGEEQGQGSEGDGVDPLAR